MQGICLEVHEQFCCGISLFTFVFHLQKTWITAYFLFEYAREVELIFESENQA